MLFADVTYHSGKIFVARWVRLSVRKDIAVHPIDWRLHSGDVSTSGLYAVLPRNPPCAGGHAERLLGRGECRTGLDQILNNIQFPRLSLRHTAQLLEVCIDPSHHNIER